MCMKPTLLSLAIASATLAQGAFATEELSNLFTQGKLALFQSGPYNLLPVSDGVADSFEWALAAPVADGPGSGAADGAGGQLGGGDAVLGAAGRGGLRLRGAHARQHGAQAHGARRREVSRRIEVRGG